MNFTADPQTMDNNITTAAPVVVQRTIFLPWNNPYNVITQATKDDILFVLQCILFPIVTIFGSTGNIISLVVLLQKKLRSSTGVMLVGLTIADLCYLLTNMARKSSCIIGRFDKYIEAYYTATIFGPIFYIITSFSRVSAWLVVLISIERFIAVFFPLKIKIWISKTRITIAVVIIYLSCFLYLIPIALQYKRGERFNRMTNKTDYYIFPSAFYFENEDILSVHNEVLGTMFFRYIPVLLTMIFNFLIIFKLQRIKLKNQKMKSTKSIDKAQKKITTMLLVIAGVCLICTFPGSLLLVMSRLIDGFENFGKYDNIFRVCSDISTLLTMINSSVNFIIYILTNREFADEFKRIFCCMMPTVEKRKTQTGSSRSKSYTQQTSGATGTWSVTSSGVRKEIENDLGSESEASAEFRSCDNVDEGKESLKQSSRTQEKDTT